MLFLPLAVVGGLGLPVLMEFFDVLVRRRSAFSPQARSALATSAGVYLVAVGILIWLWLPEGHASGDGLAVGDRGEFGGGGQRADAGAAAAVRRAVSRVGQTFLMLLMVVGGSPAGTAGGLKTTTLVRLVRGARGAMAGRAVTRAFGIALAWAAAYAAIAVACYAALLYTEPQMPADRLAFLSVSAASNVGLAHDAVSLAAPGTYVLSATMLAGRVVPVLVLLWMAKATEGEDLLVG